MVSGQSLSVNEDETVTITLQGSDEDKDDLTFNKVESAEEWSFGGQEQI